MAAEKIWYLIWVVNWFVKFLEQKSEVLVINPKQSLSTPKRLQIHAILQRHLAHPFHHHLW